MLRPSGSRTDHVEPFGPAGKGWGQPRAGGGGIDFSHIDLLCIWYFEQATQLYLAHIIKSTKYPGPLLGPLILWPGRSPHYPRAAKLHSSPGRCGKCLDLIIWPTTNCTYKFKTATRNVLHKKNAGENVHELPIKASPHGPLLSLLPIASSLWLVAGKGGPEQSRSARKGQQRSCWGWLLLAGFSLKLFEISRYKNGYIRRSSGFGCDLQHHIWSIYLAPAASLLPAFLPAKGWRGPPSTCQRSWRGWVELFTTLKTRANNIYSYKGFGHCN